MKKREPLWKCEERLFKKVKGRKWRKKSKKILAGFDKGSRPEHQKSRSEYIGNEVRKCE